ncbi:MAG: ABC transporter permease [Nitrososphaerales archaeon]
MFSPARLFAITRKELRHITRDARIFFLVTLSPAFILLVLSYLFSFDIGTVRLAWLDQDHSALSRTYLSTITADDSATVVEAPDSRSGLEHSLYAGTADIAVTVPAGFEANFQRWRATLARTQGPEILAVADGTDAISASQALSNLAQQTAAFAARLVEDAFPAASASRNTVAARIWFNSALNSQWSMVPGLLAIALTLPALALTLAVTRESEVGTLEALVASPVRGSEYLLGKVLGYVLSGAVSLALAVAVAVFWFRVPFRGNFGVLLLLTVDFYFATMGIALLISRLVSSQQTAMLVVLLVFFVPGFFLSGLILPVNTSSLSSMLLSSSLPTTHFVTITRGIFLKGATIYDLVFPAAVLALIGIFSLSLSLLTFRKRVA